MYSMKGVTKLVLIMVLCGILIGLVTLVARKNNFYKMDINNNKSETKTFLHAYKINVDLKQDDFLQKSYGAESVFDPSPDEVSILVATASEHLGAMVSYDGVALDPSKYNIQYVGVVIDGKRAIYLHMWRDGAVKVDPVNEYVTTAMLDGGDSFIDGIFEIDTRSLRLSPHGEA